MIEEPPLLRVKATRLRPTPDQLAAFQGALTGMVVDAMDGRGALDMGIKPVSAALPQSFVGVALTADNAPGDLQATLGALGHIRPGDVLVAGAQGFQGCAAAGDRVSGMARNAGAVALVTDGPVRDIGGLEGIGMAVFATGLNPNSPYTRAPGRIGFPMQIGGRTVATGDILVGDRDGVVVVPFARIDAVIARLRQVQALEAALDAEVAKGLAVPEGVRALLASDQTVTTDDA